MRRAQVKGHSLNEKTAMSLWKHYNTRLINLWDEEPFPLIRYDQDISTYMKALSKEARIMGLRFNSSIMFRDDSLKNFSGNESIPEDLKKIWTGLLKREQSNVA